jgi:nucleoside-diphosphate-sugar epimerase
MENGSELNIVFGTGPLGYAVAEELLNKGKTVRMVNRSGKADLPTGAVLISADAEDWERTREICKDAKVVYHCAMPPYTQWKELFPALTTGIMEGAASANAKLIYADNLYMYGYTDSPINENTSNNPLGTKGTVRAEMSDNLLAAHKDGKVKIAIGRASDFYGPRVMVSILGERVFKPALEGKTIRMLGNIDVPHSYIYIKDFAKGLVTLGMEPNALGEVWHIPAAEALTTRELLHLIFNETKKTPKAQTTSPFITNLLSRFNPIIKELKEVMPTYEKSYLVDHSKFQNVFGFEATPHKEAIKETVNWYKEKYSQ